VSICGYFRKKAVPIDISIEDGIAKLDGYDKRDRRESEWLGIIIHHTDIGGRTNPSEKKWRSMFTNISAYLAKKDKAYVSAHYIIGHYGELKEIIDPNKYEAFHAGKSSFVHPYTFERTKDCNRYFIGIELLGDGNLVPYSSQQMDALIKLTRKLMLYHPMIHPLCILPHSGVSPGRKVDPGRYFNWRKYYRCIFSDTPIQ
jgi:hypothetical protein